MVNRHVVSFDALNLYSTIISDPNERLFRISNVYPFEVEQMTNYSDKSFTDEWCDSIRYTRRYNAEKARLGIMKQWAELNSIDELSKIESKLKSFDVDHPEWQI